MEESTAGNVIFFTAIPATAYEQLSALRKWTHLEMGKEGSIIWLKNFDYEEINSTPVLQIPFVKRYVGKQGKLFLFDHLLPERAIPAIEWASISVETALTLPKYNFNYFGVSDKIEIKLVQSNQEKTTAALLTTLPQLTEYMSTAPAIRYQHLKWVLINYETVFLLGTPLLPIKGTSLWQSDSAFISSGYDFEMPIFTQTFTRKLIGAENRIVVWEATGKYFFINQNDLNFIDLAAVRKQKI